MPMGMAAGMPMGIAAGIAVGMAAGMAAGIAGMHVSCLPSPVVSYATASLRPSPVVSTCIGGATTDAATTGIPTPTPPPPAG